LKSNRQKLSRKKKEIPVRSAVIPNFGPSILFTYAEQKHNANGLEDKERPPTNDKTCSLCLNRLHGRNTVLQRQPMKKNGEEKKKKRRGSVSAAIMPKKKRHPMRAADRGLPITRDCYVSSRKEGRKRLRRKSDQERRKLPNARHAKAVKKYTKPGSNHPIRGCTEEMKREGRWKKKVDKLLTFHYRGIKGERSEFAKTNRSFTTGAIPARGQERKGEQKGEPRVRTSGKERNQFENGSAQQLVPRHKQGSIVRDVQTRVREPGEVKHFVVPDNSCRP